VSTEKFIPNKLNRGRAIRLSKIEGMHLTSNKKSNFAEFDANGIESATRRSAIWAYFKANNVRYV